MKLDAATVEALRERIAPLDTQAAREVYRAGRFPRAEAVKDLDKRYRWDLFYAARCWEVSSGDVADAHIDTALRRIVAPLGVSA